MLKLTLLFTCSTVHVSIEHIVYSAQMYENIFSQRSNWFSGHQGTPGCDGTSRQSRKKSEYKKCPADLVIPIFSELFVVCSTKCTQARHYCSFSKRLRGCSQWVNSVEAVDSIKYKFVIRKCLYTGFLQKGFCHLLCNTETRNLLYRYLELSYTPV